MTAEERKYIVGRWVRMFSAIMIGLPVLSQFAIKALAMEPYGYPLVKRFVEVSACDS